MAFYCQYLFTSNLSTKNILKNKGIMRFSLVTSLSPLSANTAPPACTLPPPLCSPLASPHAATFAPKHRTRQHPSPAHPYSAHPSYRSPRPSPLCSPLLAPCLHAPRRLTPHRLTSCRHIRPSPRPSPARPYSAHLSYRSPARPSFFRSPLCSPCSPLAATFTPKHHTRQHPLNTGGSRAALSHGRQPCYRAIVAWLPPCPFCTFRRSVCYRVIFAYRPPFFDSPPRTPALSLLRIRYSPFGGGCAFCTTIAHPPPLHPTLYSSHRWQSCTVPKAAVV